MRSRCSGLNMLTGFNGQISLGHGAFFAIGAYVAAILMTSSARPIGRRFRSPAWSASSPASCSACRRCASTGSIWRWRPSPWRWRRRNCSIIKAFDAWTGGVQGLQLGKPHAPFGLPLTADQWLYFLCLACAALLFWAAANLVRGRVGRAIVAIRDHPIAAEAMGVNMRSTRRRALASARSTPASPAR